MAGRSCRAWFSVLLGLVVGFTLASFVILPRATELKNAGQKRASTGGCGLQRGLRRDYSGAQVWQPQQDNSLLSTDKPVPRSKNFLFVGVMTAQKYLDNRVVAAHRYVTVLGEGDIPLPLCTAVLITAWILCGIFVV